MISVRYSTALKHCLHMALAALLMAVLLYTITFWEISQGKHAIFRHVAGFSVIAKQLRICVPVVNHKAIDAGFESRSSSLASESSDQCDFEKD